ncbi:hypothetical protein EYE40_01595 [Glaciihabitans arcticus]|uniref:Uncharacterized protein n=1 Tax=Glaciihabitans arcticus TaxID=2668039 RepID=A0A4Q9GNC7_9MICO|nr:hypothetical protein [Glaciihabitans arcticus]TBN56191.1 hypothetical protein EYE40_01595 [Glaciihabitans arcticus]
MGRKSDWAMDPGMPFGPGSPQGSILNVVICSVLTIGALWIGFAGDPWAFAIAALGAVGTVRFIVIAVGANRGD